MQSKLNIVIRRPTSADLDKLDSFFEVSLTSTIAENNLQQHPELLAIEIADKREFIRQDLASDGMHRHFLVAEHEGAIIGTVAYGPTGNLLADCTNNELVGWTEIGTMFVLPEFQRQGLSALLLDAIGNALLQKGIAQICFDSGYPVAQKIWTKKFGAPKYHLQDYWGEGEHHMVWVLETTALLLSYAHKEAL